jgi:hypothetical protein
VVICLAGIAANNSSVLFTPDNSGEKQKEAVLPVEQSSVQKVV